MAPGSLLGLLTSLVLLVRPADAVLPRHRQQGLGQGASFLADLVADLERKPTKGAQAVPTTIVDTESAKEKLREISNKLKGRAPKPSSLKCGEPEHIDWRSVDRDRCPETCPFLVEDLSGDVDLILAGKNDKCRFVCVANQHHCAILNPNATVADREMGVCRPCMVAGCEVCNQDGTDTCTECAAGYWLARNGAECRTRFDLVWQTGLALLAIFGVVLAAWAVHLHRRPVTNKEGLRHGQNHRDRTRLTQGSTSVHSATTSEDFRRASGLDQDEVFEEDAGLDPVISARTRRLRRSWKEWPLSTNLLKTPVAGPGLVAHFNFQAAVILWALGVALSWMVLAAIFDGDLLVVGTQTADSPRHYCYLLSWGYRKEEQQYELKAAFVFCVYVVSFVMVLVYCAYQMRRFEHLDTQSTTMKDFVALASGLPPMSGDRKVEEELRDLFRKETGEPVVGVVALWDMTVETTQEVTDAMDANLGRLHAEAVIRAISSRTSGYDISGHDTWLHGVEKSVLQAYTGVEDADAAAERYQPDVGDLLRGLNTSGFAIVVFDTEHARDAAVEKVNAQGGMKMEGGFTAHLEQVHAEPFTLVFSNFLPRDTWLTTARRWLVSIAEIVIALLVWVLVFYAPYVYFVLGFSYKNGTSVSTGAEISLTLVVALGNQVMYIVCGDAATRLRFRYKDDTQAAYTGMYFVACLVNVAADLIVTFKIAHMMMANQGLRNVDGVPLQDLTFMEVFETFGMQRELGNQLYAYAFPATFLVPFILEPFALIFIPYWLMTALVRSHPECSDEMVEKAFECADMDLARYADILLNIGIAVLMFAFPCGFTHMTFLALAFSHIYIFAYDHWRVLRATKVCMFANSQVERTTQLLLSIPCGLLLAIWVLESNPLHGMPGHKQNMALVMPVLAAFVAHIVLHILLVLFLVPRFRTEHGRTNVTFGELATTIPRSWFTLSQTYCLRSEHIYGHKPPCRPFVPGKEYILELNPEACSYYSADKAMKSPPPTPRS